MTWAEQPKTDCLRSRWARCIGACGLAPAMMIDGTVYKQVTPMKLNAILAKYRE